MEDWAKEFKREAVFRLREEYLPRLRKDLEALPAASLWWRPHASTNSVGILLRHLRGNVTQWILSGMGGREDQRVRKREFEGEPGGDAAGLYRDLEAAVLEACAVIESLTPEGLLAKRVIQGHPVTGLSAVFHVVEHFSWHTGQITWIAKLCAGAGHGVAFYDDARLNAAGNG